MEEELISVIVPIFNVEDYLPRCLECIREQTYRHLEIILVDDGSTDGSGRICDEYAAKDPRARVIHQPNTGCWAARNTGQDAATGEYLWFPDGDDYFHKDIVKTMHEAINRTGSDGKKYDLAMVGHRRTSGLDEDVSCGFDPLYVEKTIDELWDCYIRPNDVFLTRNMWNKLFRRECVKGIRAGKYQYAQDCDYNIKFLMTRPKTILVANDLYYWLIRSGSAIQSAGYQIASIQCRTRIEYANLLAGKDVVGRRYLLEALYISMIQWLDLIEGNEDARDVTRECNRMIKDTWRDYLHCSEIRSYRKRLGRILRVRFNNIYRFLYVVY